MADQLAPWLSLFAVLFFEIAAAASLVVDQALAQPEFEPLTPLP